MELFLFCKLLIAIPDIPPPDTQAEQRIERLDVLLPELCIKEGCVILIPDPKNKRKPKQNIKNANPIRD